MKKLAISALTLLSILGAIFYLFWMPLPTTPARDAIGMEKSIDLNGRTLAYYVSGADQPVILLASAGREASDFNELSTALNDADYKTIAIEAQGIKGSDLAEGEFSLFDIADDM